MFFEPRHGMRPAPLSHNPLNSLICPRPIGWISTIDSHGQPNLAPFSYFNAVSSDPPYLMFAPNAKGPGEHKDSYRNLETVPEFVANLCSVEAGQAMNATSAGFDYGVDEFDACGIESAPCRIVRPLRVAAAAAAFECTVYQIVNLPQGADGRMSHVVIGEVVGIHINDDLIENGCIDARKLDPLARLGAFNYATLGEVLEIPRPG